ncbi:MAG: nucleotide cyclase [Monoraphidium minutum]|nr:MAG: nucleotide cyclase [Monoraphidium minutum]
MGAAGAGAPPPQAGAKTPRRHSAQPALEQLPPGLVPPSGGAGPPDGARANPLSRASTGCVPAQAPQGLLQSSLAHSSAGHAWASAPGMGHPAPPTLCGGGGGGPAARRASGPLALTRLLTMRRSSQHQGELPAAGLAAEEPDCWHEVQASRFQDPVTGEEVTMLIQTDVTGRVAAERALRQVLDAEHNLLEDIFPRQVLEAMTALALRGPAAGGGAAAAAAAGGGACGLLGPGGALKMALHHEQVSILFADIVGFTSMAKTQPPDVVMDLLNDLFTRFDMMLEEYSVYKVETIGDCYMVAGGLIFTDAQGYRSVLQSQVDPLHAQHTLRFARAMLAAAAEVPMPGCGGAPVQLRVGIHSGPVVSGVVGARMPRFCLFGDTVNTASRMESTGPPGSIHVSAGTAALAGGGCWAATGGVMVKGKGVMTTYLYDEAAPAAAAGDARRRRREAAGPARAEAGGGAATAGAGAGEGAGGGEGAAAGSSAAAAAPGSDE